MLVDKECISCNIEMLGVNHQTKYCDQCREISNKKSAKKYKKKNRENLTKDKEEELISNFYSVVEEPRHTTVIGFNEVSSMSCKTYMNFYQKPWIEILKMYNKYEELLEYVISEYREFINNTGKKNFRDFYDNHQYIGGQLLKTIGTDNIRALSGISKDKKFYTYSECKDEFYRLIDFYQRVPLYTEFLESSKISLKVFIRVLNIQKRNNSIYDVIVKSFVTDDVYREYLINRHDHKTQVGKDNHQGFKHTDKELIENLTNIFDNYYAEYNSYPSLHLFDKISKIRTSNYTRRFNKTWKEVCSDFGYDITKEVYKSEKIALGILQEILDEEYESQKTFDWLKGFKGFPLFCDGYFPNHKLIVEFDGDQHRYPIKWFGGMKTFNEIKTNDKYKDVLIPRNGLKLFRISSEEPFTDKEYIKDKLIRNKII